MIPTFLDLLPPEKVAHILPQQFVKQAQIGKAIKEVAKGVAVFGAGTAAGYGVGALAGKVYQAATGEKIPPPLLLPAASLLGAGFGLAYAMHQAKSVEELQRAFKARHDKSKGSDSGK